MTRTGESYPALHELFEKQAASAPDAVALSMEGAGDITYADLDRRSDAMALNLHSSGVSPKSHVAMLTRTGPAHVVGMLAVLKCGAAFATLDADEPTARQQQIIDQLEPSALLLDAGLRDSADRLAGRFARIAIAGGDDHDHLRASRTPVEVSPADPAFIAFTSGSTGRPKGIVQSHRSFAQFLTWFGRTFTFQPGTRLAQWAAPMYDAAYCEILGGLAHGATVCLVPRHARNNPDAFLRWCARSQITVLQIVPSYAAQLLTRLKDADSTKWQGLRYLLLAGEELTPSLARGLAQVLPKGVDIYNLYGPSECVLASYHRVTEEDLNATSIPIGQAIDGRELIVLDETGTECGTHATGEICVRSEFLADGYLNDAIQTARVFIDRGSGRSRELRTGDLGRRKASGLLEWLGRRDNMVKRRGVRIEIEEVERRLRDLPEVSECAVTALRTEASRGEVVLVAVIVPAAGSGLLGPADAHERIRRRAASVMPTQLIPDSLMLADGLPKLHNGKLDRNALITIAARQPHRQTGTSAALTRTEEQVMRIYSEVLGVNPIGATDDFFALGGHSLLAMTVLDRISAISGILLPMLAIFERPTARQLAALVDLRTGGQNPAPGGPAPPASREYPLTPGQVALWLADHLQPGNPAYNVPLVTAIRGQVSAEILEQSLRDVISRHDILRAAYKFDGQDPIQIIDSDITLKPLRIIDLSGYPVQTRRLNAAAAVRDVIDSPFDLEAGHLIRCALVTLDRDEHIFVVALHHLVCDEPSLHILADDIADLYEAAVAGRPAPVPPRVQFGQFVNQRAGPDAEAADTGLPVAEVPSEQLRRAASGIPAHRVRGILSQRQTAAVRTLASHAGTTLFTTLLTAFGVSLRSQTPVQGPLIVDVPVSRRHERFSRCVGCFVETAHVSFASTREATFRQLLKRAHNQMSEVGSTSADGRPAADARALFTVHAEAMPFVQLSNFDCIPYFLDRNTAKYNLGFYWRDEGAVLSYIVEYATDIYESSYVRDLISCYESIIDQACVNPDAGPLRPGVKR